MNTMKKLGLAACAATALMAQAAVAQRTDEGYLTGIQEEFGYGQFTADLGTFCGAAQPFTASGQPVWTCSGGVDMGIRVETRSDLPTK